MAENTLSKQVNKPLPEEDKDLKTSKFKEFCQNNKGYLYMLPALIFILIFTIYPIINTLLSAFKNNFIGLYGTYDGFGFQNFKKVFEYKQFTNALTNTLLFAFISVPVSLVLALLISVWLNSIKWFQKLYQTLFFLPYLTNAIAVGSVFAAMFNVVGGTAEAADATSIGLVNTLLKLVGFQPIYWVNPGASLAAQRFVVILYSIWASLPFKILIIFSALQSVNKQYYDAAKIDGASKFKTLRRVTVPLISPMLSYLLVTGFIGGFKEYSSVVGIFGTRMGAEQNNMNTMVGFIYDRISDGRTGLAAAGALVLFAIILLFTLVNLYFSKKRVHY